MCGVAGSGKATFARQLEYPIASRRTLTLCFLAMFRESPRPAVSLLYHISFILRLYSTQ